MGDAACAANCQEGVSPIPTPLNGGENMPAVVDLNADLGEGYGNYKLGLDEEVIKEITSANIACGLHAGDPMVMRRTVKLAREAGTAVGAHPGYPDLQGFGRRNISLSPAEVRNFVVWQVGALWAFARAEGVPVQHVKAHGAMYNMAAADRKLADAIAEAVAEVDSNLILVGLAGSELLLAGRRAGLRTASEVFADRGYNSDGSLVKRGTPGAIINDPQAVAGRVLKMVREGKVTAADGGQVAIKADTICFHGDTPGAVELARTVRAALEQSGVRPAPMGSFLGS